MNKYKAKDRVVHGYLGSGRIKKIMSKEANVYLVMFDKTPDVRYNMGENPTLVFGANLTPEPVDNLGE